MPDLFLKRESSSELHFEHSILSGWLFAGIGLVIAYFGLRHADSTALRWVATGMGSFFALIGAGGALWRYELTLDLASRSYRGRRGFWPSPRTLHGSLSELDGVLLTRSYRRGENADHAVWVVSLELQGWDKSVSVFETTSERKGYRKLEELARRLHVAAIDRTGDEESRRAPDALDRSVADRKGERDARSIHTVEEPPPESGIEWRREGSGAPMIVLPALGLNLGAVLLGLFGLPFLFFGALALASAVGWTGIEVEGTLAAKWIVGGVFVVVGILCAAGAVFGSVAREVIREEGDALVVTLRTFGRHYRRRRLPRREIEDVSIKPSGSARSRARRRRSEAERTEVVLRTDQVVARVAGDLPPDGQRWLLRALLALARR